MTTRLLSQITDNGFFERLATAVLRVAAPTLYSTLSQPGVNPDGDTVKSPVDAITFVPGADPPHMILVQHTRSGRSRAKLRHKWLFDPVLRDKGKTTVAESGDAIKALAVVIEERKRTPDLRVTLALTTTQEPTDDLRRDIEAFGKAHGIQIDIWAGSCIANFLDVDPDGEWLRDSFFQIAQRRLSRDLLRKLSKASVDGFPLFDDPDCFISRRLDIELARQTTNPVTFLIGEPGLGKTIACYRLLRAHIEAGGYGLVLDASDLAESRTLDQAIDAALRKLHPTLIQGSGLEARSQCGHHNPLLLVVEDINRSGQQEAMLERLTAWALEHSRRDGSGHAEAQDWRLLCPVWPEVVAKSRQEARKKIEQLAIFSTSFTPEEATFSIERRAGHAAIPISSFDADKLAHGLGNDPLLIGLYDFNKAPDPRRVIEGFIESGIEKTATHNNELTATDLLMALDALAQALLTHRCIDPSWGDILDWFHTRPDIPGKLSVIAHEGVILRLVKDGRGQRLAFRHDRIRSWLLVRHIANKMLGDSQDIPFIGDPFFEDIIGSALAEDNIPIEMVEQVRIANPLALFHALKAFQEPRSELHREILKAISTWLGDESTHGRVNDSLRWAAQLVLSDTESSHVLPITQLFRNRSWAIEEARLLNGDLRAGLNMCLMIDVGATFPRRNRLIAHAQSRFGETFLRDLGELLDGPALSARERSGALRLAGFMADPRLADAVMACWRSDPDESSRLADYLWAAAKCCGDKAELLLEPICDAWAALSDTPAGTGLPSPRDDLAADHLSWAFRDAVPLSAIGYFVARARSDEALRWPITYMLRSIDHPDTVEYLAHYFAERSRESKNGEYYSMVSMMLRRDWERRGSGHGTGMSSASKQRLESLWRDESNDIHLRRQAFLLWDVSHADDDLRVLITLPETMPFWKDILRARLERGDQSAIPFLLQELPADESGRWWQLGRHLWSDALTQALDTFFRQRSMVAPNSWHARHATDGITSELLMRMKPATAEKLLVDHWGYLGHSLYFVQAALYIATPLLQCKVREAMEECPDPVEMLKHLHFHYGILVMGHPGVNRLEQMEALIPYLDHLGSSDIHSLWDNCNKRGWYDYRRTHLDNRLEDPWRTTALDEESNMYSDLDKHISENRVHLIYFWMDRHIEMGESLEKIFGRLCDWLLNRQSIDALKLVAEAYQHRGRRVDLNLLKIEHINPAEEAVAIFHDTQFAVYRRSLV